MKYVFLITISLFSILQSFAQSYTTPIDVTVNSIYGDEIGALKLKSSTVNQFMYAAYLDQFSSGILQVIKPGLGVQSLLLNPQGGNVGIGTTSPVYNFQVQKTSALPAMMISGGHSRSPRLQVYGLESDPQAWMGLGADMGGGDYEHSIYFSTGPVSNRGKLTIGDYDGTTYNIRMIVHQNGNVGIGTTTPNERLAVNGKIRAQEIKVETTNWPDYVFAQDYSLPTLQETEKHIKEKGHLPGIPSAAEVKANGIDLGEMNAILLQKIEELTLHLIEMKKDSEEYKNCLNRLQLELNELKPKSLAR